IRDCPVAKRDICPAYPGSMGFSCWTLTESTRCQDCEVYRRQQFLTERLSGVGETLPSRDASGRVM
ncbi:MAG: hypothetical protein KJ734_05690, partial [Chloroflexi bacterium]|nr:hypothetical protein [Chloroflexota bacterium]